MSNVTLKQLRAFLSLARERSFTKAAAKLHVSQSALTLQIRILEDEVGVRLFDRSTRSVDLTGQGAEFHPVVEGIMDQLSRALVNLRAVSDPTTGAVTVAAGSSVISLVIAPAVVRLGEAYPGIAVRIIEHAGADLASRVIKGDADFGIASLTKPNSALDAQPLFKDRFGVLCTAKHPLALQKKKIMWPDLSSHAFVMLARGTDTREMLDGHPAIGPALPRPAFEVASLSALFSLVERGAGFTLLPGVAAYPALRSNLVFRPVWPAMSRELYFIRERKRRLSPAARRLASTIIDELRTLRKTSQLNALMEVAGDLASLQDQFNG